jgi:hypothetical protein
MSVHKNMWQEKCENVFKTLSPSPIILGLYNRPEVAAVQGT